MDDTYYSVRDIHIPYVIFISNAVFIVSTVLICAMHAAGLAGVHVNLVPYAYGMDQLPGTFAEELSSYFHWYYWCTSAGVFFISIFSIYLLGAINASYVLLVATVSYTVALVINFIGMGSFSKADKVGNSLLLIFRVVSYAAIAKKPVE